LKKRTFLVGALLIGFLTVGFVALAPKATASTNQTPPSWAPTVKHNQISSVQLSLMTAHGLHLGEYTGNAPRITENQALENVRQWVEQFDPNHNPISIRMEIFTRTLSAGTVATVDSSVSAGDSHIVNGKLNHVPCWVLTITNTNLPGATSNVAKDLNIVIDATNGQFITAFAVTQMSASQ